jgi:hypothetical protein
VTKLGPTGEFPRGKLNKTDEGALMIAVGHENGVVRVEFGTPTAWIGLPPEEALAFAALIVRHVMELKHAEDLGRRGQSDQKVEP